MLIDVGDQTRNIALNTCFFSILVLTLVAIVPWRAFGAIRLSHLLRWLVVPVLAIAIGYEFLMPSRFNIRIDLFFLLPMYVVIVVTSFVRWRSYLAS